MEFETILRGVSFRPIDAKAHVNQLEEGDVLLLERESDNAFDPNAIKVLSADGSLHLGYVAKEVAVELAPFMDEGKEFTAKVNSIMMKQIILVINEKPDEYALSEEEIAQARVQGDTE